MEFTFETRYDAKTMTVMARALRKTVRKNTAADPACLAGSSRLWL